MNSDAKLIADVATLKTQNEFILKYIGEIRYDVKKLNAFRWKVSGVAIAFGAFGAAIYEAIKGH